MSGGGAQGHLAIIMTQVEYSAISAMPWAEPYTHGSTPLITDGTNAVDASQIARLHDEFRLIHANSNNVDQPLERIILEAYDNMYTSQFKDYLRQYESRSALEILMHLIQTYAFINPTPQDDGHNQLSRPN
jgi:hypothetical protein